MIGPGSDVRVLICTKPVDFRLGIDGLVALIQNELGFDPYAAGIAHRSQVSSGASGCR